MSAIYSTPSPLPQPGLVEVPNSDAVVDIWASTGYYQGMQGVLGFLVAGRSKDELTEAHRQIESNSVQPNTWQHHYLMLLMFCQSFETQVRERGLFRTVSEQEFENQMS